ncbi:cation:proton antiporter [Actinoplanes sp. NPDC020271]|uniref:cation:proton antiporter domain-containing protein n=1 Tax=Actinoplanes sp. NPDC020271 TaxID=3363896 RepID=UPI00378C7BC0
MSTALPGLDPHVVLVFLLQASLLLGVAFALGRLAERLGLPALVGELLTGVILGPSLLGTLTPGLLSFVLPADAEPIHLIDAVGQFGVLLLVGVTGIQLDGRLLRRRGATGLRVSLSGPLLPLALGIGAGFLVPAVLTIATYPVVVLIAVVTAVTGPPILRLAMSRLEQTPDEAQRELVLAGGAR